MKRLVLPSLMLFASILSASAWGRLGHEVVIAVAQRHLTEKTKENISEYFSYDLKKDAVWMDIHRDEYPIEMTTNWHTCYFDENLRYDPLVYRKMKTGDAVRALNVVDAAIGDDRYKDLPDSSVVFCVRMLIHFVGDIHCPTHNHHSFTASKWDCTLNGKKYNFHTVYDRMPVFVWGKTSADDIAAKIDNASKRQRKAIVSGDLYDWLADIGPDNVMVYKWNAPDTPVLRDDTIELSTDLINKQMRNAGYRLAHLLNMYFDR